KQNQKKFDITLHNTEDYALCFEELIQVIHQKHQKQVVILIDEYDKPILDFLDKTTLAIEARDILKRLYHVIKDNDQYIKFAFLTGVSKFAKVSIFSGLNNLEDISLDADYATIAGYTQKDIESSFAEHLKDVDLQKLKQWYNGYNFLGEDIYNPFDILLFISKGGMYRNYWFGTGTPHFLIKLLQQKDYFIPQLENLVVDESIIDSFDIENLSIEPILYQSGYLTINEVIDDERRLKFSLKLPNKEVKISLNDLFIDYLTNQTLDKIKFQDNLYDALTKNDLESFKSTLITLFSSIPYNNYVNNNIAHFEGYYSSVIYAYLASLGITIIAEDITNKGRIDLTIQLDHAIYIIEFKVGNENALMQIIHKNYASKYLNDNKAIYLVGINFDSAERNITNFNYKQVKMTTRLV
ncbi:MAG: AAA family ATPase, partial [Methylococcales bacterium]|nr:AAA family ATPase [Methylococcales bacterium]